MKKIPLIILILGLIAALGIIFSGGGGEVAEGNNVEIREGVQYVTVDARGGYFPRVSEAQAGIPTKLVMKTSGTYDCSAALVIKDINYQNILPPKGETEIDLGVASSGKTISGLCSMGMYNFEIKFN